MNRKLCVRIGEHDIRVNVFSENLEAFLKTYFLVTREGSELTSHCDLLVHIRDGYGEPFVDFTVNVFQENGRVIYQRKDYQIEIDNGYREAQVSVRDAFALKHALMNLYSAFAVFHNWGLLIHSSCVIDKGNAHLFAGQSGAGKSTVAKLSQPRTILSDEASVVHVGDTGVRVYDSPFRSDSVPDFYVRCYPLSSLNLLEQSPFVERSREAPSDAMFAILDKVFYWDSGPAERAKVLRLAQQLIEKVPAFRLQFCKSPSFWEAIS